MKPFILGTTAFVIIIMVLGYYLVSEAPAKAVLTKENGVQITYNQSNYDFGTVKLTSGLVVRKYPIKNSGQKDLKIANLASSCACTKVYFKSANQESPRASMKGMTRVTDWVGVLKPEEAGEMIMEFDPNFHGPAGVGKIVRSLSFETNDPNNSYIELRMNGEVIK